MLRWLGGAVRIVLTLRTLRTLLTPRDRGGPYRHQIQTCNSTRVRRSPQIAVSMLGRIYHRVHEQYPILRPLILIISFIWKISPRRLLHPSLLRSTTQTIHYNSIIAMPSHHPRTDRRCLSQPPHLLFIHLPHRPLTCLSIVPTHVPLSHRPTWVVTLCTPTDQLHRFGRAHSRIHHRSPAPTLVGRNMLAR